jgi:hypothetical protein
MKLQIIVILLATFGVVTGLAAIGDEQIFITVTSEGKAKVSQALFPETFVSTVDVKVISEKISNLLAIDEENILLGTSQEQDLLKIATLGASSVDLKYNADILSYESGVFKLKYNSDVESRVNLPPLSKLVSLNTIPIEITDEEYVLPPGDISLSFSIRPVTSKEFFVPVDDSQYKVEAITAAKIEGFSANSEQIQFIIKDKAIVLTIIPTEIMANPNDALLNGETVDFTQFHKNSTHSWIRIDPHEKGLVKILDTTEKTEKGGGCLIATATYGTEMAPQVQLLREIRDNQLMNTDSGESFMTGFNSVYYSFSPYVADLQRESPLFKEIVKIGITPLLSSLYFMEYAETDEEVLGLGISVILLNIGMYFIFPFAIWHQSLRFIRTRGMKKSNWDVISSGNVRTVLKIGLLGLIALFVLSVSIPSAFAQSTESEEQNPIRVILDISYENIQESFVDSGIGSENYPVVYTAAQEEYEEAIAALEAGDLKAAEESALLAMALFEESAKDLAEKLEVQEATIQPLGLSTAATSIFNVQEGITNTDNETNELRELVKLNNFDDVDFSEYEESVNLAKTLLADGYVPDAQAQLELANAIKDNLYKQIGDAASVEAAEEIKERLGEQENLGLTKKEIRELEVILEDITNDETGDSSSDSGDEAPGNSADAPGQNKDNSGDEAPGNSADAPGQNKDNSGDEDSKEFESVEDIPGFGSASDTGKENGQGNGLGLGDIGNIPPGLAKLFGLDETGDDTESEISEDLPPGLASIAPGQAKKFEDYSASFEQSPDDFYENHYEASIDGIFEANYDGTNKANGDGKGLFGAFPGRSGDFPEAKKENSGSKKCTDKGITDGGSATNTGVIGTIFNVLGFKAIGNGCNDVTKTLQFNIISPNGTDINGPAPITADQPIPFTPDTDGEWEIQANIQTFAKIRTVTVDPIPGFTANAGPDQLGVTLSGGPPSATVNLSGSGTGSGTISYEWVIENVGTGGTPSLTDNGDGTAQFTVGNGNKGHEYLLTLIVRDTGNYGYAADTLTVTIAP